MDRQPGVGGGTGDGNVGLDGAIRRHFDGTMAAGNAGTARIDTTIVFICLSPPVVYIQD
jgi:hypothetical protein